MFDKLLEVVLDLRIDWNVNETCQTSPVLDDAGRAKANGRDPHFTTVVEVSGTVGDRRICTSDVVCERVSLAV